MATIVSKKTLKLILYNKNASFIRKTLCNNLILHSKYSTEPTIYADKDPAPVFFNNDVQHWLTILSRIDLNRIFRKRKDEHDLQNPEYKFLTTEQLETAMQQVREKIAHKVQMPPVIKVHDDSNRQVISRDPALKGLDPTKFVFTDITFGVSDVKRIIVTREPDGTLVVSDWNTRNRMNQLYFPKPGRNYVLPRMFSEPFLQDLLNKFEYEFILDRACVQFEPNDQKYQLVTATTYLHVDQNETFNYLRSTRHFGPMSFYLAWIKSIDKLLLDIISSQENYLHEAAALVRLFYKIHNISISRSIKSDLELINEYIEKNATGKIEHLQLALQAHQKGNNDDKVSVNA